MLVEFQPGVRVGNLGIARMARELTALLGRSVDVRTLAELQPAFSEKVLKEVMIGYVAA